MVFRNLHTHKILTIVRQKSGTLFQRVYQKVLINAQKIVKTGIEKFQNIPSAWKHYGLAGAGALFVLVFFIGTSYAVLSGNVQLGSSGNNDSGQLAAASAALEGDGTEEVQDEIIPGTSGAGGGFGSFTTAEDATRASDGVLNEELTAAGEAVSGGDTYGATLYDAVGDQAAPVEVFYHTGPADGSTADKGATEVGYKIEVDELQEAGDDYTSTLTYIATPTF